MSQHLLVVDFDETTLRVYLATGATDIRKSIDTLAILVAEQLDLDPLSGLPPHPCDRHDGRCQ